MEKSQAVSLNTALTMILINSETNLLGLLQRNLNLLEFVKVNHYIK